MKQTSKIFTNLAILLVIMILIPSITFADNNKENTNNGRFYIFHGLSKQAKEKNNSEAERNKQICNNIEGWAEKINQTIIEQQYKIEEKQTERQENLEQKRENRDIKLEDYREKWDEHWDEHFAKLEEKASTSEEKQALVEFKETVINAMASRQEAIDMAITDFRVALDEIILDRKNAVDDAKTAFENAYQAAVNQAKADCIVGTDTIQIRSTLKDALKAVRDKYNQDRQAIEKTELKPLVDTRQELIKEALDYFNNIMETERTKLKTVFSEPETEK